MSEKKSMKIYDFKECYPNILREFIENEKKSVNIVVTGEKGAGMTYRSLYLGKVLEKEKRTKEGNLQIETMKVG